MTEIAYGPRASIDGPPPVAPRYGLLQATDVPASGVRLIPDADADGIERWATAEVYPYPSSPGGVHVPCIDPEVEKDFDDDRDIDREKFAAFTVYMPVSCTMARVPSQEEFRARALTAFAAIEGSLAASEFMRGALLGDQKYLADGGGVFPNGDTDTSVRNGIALLEEQIALTGKRGVIHASPSVVDSLGGLGHGVVNDGGVLATTVGTVVVPDAGYAGGSQPIGKTAGEWMYATGPVDVRRAAQPYVIPERVEEALDRGTGATRDKSNQLTYLVEREYLVVWDGVLQAAVRVDRCQDGCT